MLKIEKQANNLIIKNDGDVSVLDVSTLANAHQVIATLSAALEKSTQANHDLQKAMGHEMVEEYAIEKSLALFRDVTMNVPSQVSKGIKSSLSFAPSHLQGQVLKHVTKSMAQIYKDAAEMVMACDDTNLLYKSLIQKAAFILRDVELLSEKMDEPLERIQQIKLEKSMRNHILQKGISQGKAIAKAEGYVGIDAATLETAAALNKTKTVLKDNENRLNSAIKSAKNASK